MYYSLAEIQNITSDELSLKNDNSVITAVEFDSRRPVNSTHTLFFCLRGKSRSGNQFVADAYKKGIRNFVVEKPFDTVIYPDANFIFSENPLLSLQKLAAFHRSKFTGPVVGITGSNGKTIVKEWLYNLLKSDFNIHRSPRSFNSGLGVAISLLGIEKENNFALIEAGISAPGEMQILENMIRPSLGIITHLGAAHDENFSDRNVKAIEKVTLFENADVIVYPHDSYEIRQAIQNLKANKPLIKTISWGKKEGSNFRIIGNIIDKYQSVLSFVHRGTEHQIKIPFVDEASLENTMTCLCTLAAFERWDEQHIEAFQHLTMLENRLSFFEGKNGNYIVNDSYSNDIDSLQVALDFFQRQQPDMPNLVILSDLEQSEKDKPKLYTKVADILKENKIQELYLVGSEIENNRSVFNNFSVTFFKDSESLLNSGILGQIHNKSILIKGARSFKLENVVALLRKQMHQTVMQIDLNAVRTNFNYFRNLCDPSTKIMAMVKAFGYGSGSFEAARTLQFMGADYLAVAYTDEGVSLRKAGITMPVMVMNCGVEDIQTLQENNLEPVIFNEEGIRDFAAGGFDLNVHIEVDTGMHRLGFDAGNILKSFESFPSQLKVQSVFSHLSASEAEHHDVFTHLQIQTFRIVCTNIEKLLGYSFIKHIANTGAIFRFPDAILDMVRLGIGMYGIDPSGLPNPNLEVVATLKTHISQLRKVDAGDSVGYSRKSITSKDRLIATLPIGYADGFWRRMGNGNGSVIIRGKQAPLVGNICMDMCMADVTDIDCNEGDEVEIFGKQQRVEKVAEACDTISYEILTSVSQRVRREYVGEN